MAEAGPPRDEIEALRARVHELEQLLQKHFRSDDLQMESGVASRSGEPFVHLRWGDQAGQLTPDDARQHAVAIMDCSAAAEFDAALIKVFTDDPPRGLGLPYGQAVGFLGEIRERRGGPRDAAAAASGPEPAP